MMEIISVILGVASVCLSIYYVFIHKRKKNYPPGPWGLPIIGHLLYFDIYPADTFKVWANKYGNIFSIRMGSHASVVMNGYEVIKAAAEHDNNVFSDRINFLSFGMQKELDGGISTLTTCFYDETFIQARKGIANALKIFTSGQNSSFTQIVQQAACDLRNNILAKGNNEAINIYPDIETAIATIMFKIVYGRENDDARVNDQLQVFLRANKHFNEFAGKGNLAEVIPWWRYLIQSKISEFFNTLKLFTDAHAAEITRHEESFVSEFICDITDFFINERQNNTRYSDHAYKVMINSLKELFAAGFDTSSNTLKYLILYMVSYPEEQKKVHKELDSVIGLGRPIDLSDRKSLPYSAAVMYEVLRITTIVPFAIPHRAARSTTFMNYDIDEGTFVTFNLASVNKEQEYWGDPDSFRPARFIDDTGNLIRDRCNRVASFSFGKRSCVGEQVAKQQIFLIFATLMQHCEFLCSEGDPINLEQEPGLVYHPKENKVVVKERKDA